MSSILPPSSTRQFMIEWPKPGGFRRVYAGSDLLAKAIADRHQGATIWKPAKGGWTRTATLSEKDQ